LPSASWDGPDRAIPGQTGPEAAAVHDESNISRRKCALESTLFGLMFPWGHKY
jgi:hypothetical protein